MAGDLDSLASEFFAEITKRVSSSTEFGHVYVVDTNVVHGFPEAIEILAHVGSEQTNKPNIVVISDIVRKELDGLKRSPSIDKSADARIAIAGIEGYFTRPGCKPIEGNDGRALGVEFENGSLMLLLPYSGDFPQLRPFFGCDDEIIASALYLRKKLSEKLAEQGKKVSIVSDDSNLKTSCRQFGMPCAKFGEFYKDADYTGFVEVNAANDSAFFKMVMSAHRQGQEIPIETVENHFGGALLPNQFVTFAASGIDPRRAMRVDAVKGAVRPLYNFNKFLRESRRLSASDSTEIKQAYHPSWEQECALELLFDPDINFVTLSGPPGGGKTMLPLHVGLVLLQAGAVYSVVVSNPPISAEHGFLPGTKDEKLIVENQNIFDNLFYLLGVNDIAKRSREVVEGEIMDMLKKGTLEMETLTYIKGRTLPSRLIIFDEAEDYELRQMRKLASRLGRDSKIVFVGDPYQVDNPHCSRLRNGLVYFISRFKGEPTYGHVKLSGIARSQGAELAAKLL